MMKCGHFMLFLLYVVYIDLYEPTFYVNGKVGHSCNGDDTSTCGSQPTHYRCKNNQCFCGLKLFFQDDDENCVPYKDPLPPSKVEIVNITASNFTVKWTRPAEYPGPMFYNIEIYETDKRDSSIADKWLYTAVLVDDTYNITEYFYSLHVVGDWSYRAAVKVHLLNGQISNKTYSKQIRTPTAPAGIVQSFRVIVLGYNRSSAEVWWKCPNEKERNGVLTNYIIEMKLNGSYEINFFTIPVDDYADENLCKYEKKIVIKPGNVYTFTIRANNKDYPGEEYMEQYVAEEATPYLSQLHEAIFKYNPVSTTETTITFEYCSKCLLDDSNGAITYSALLICHYQHCQDNRLVTIDEQIIRKFTSWRQAKEAGFTSPFSVTTGDWITPSNKSEFSTFTAGNEDGCDAKPPETICNGPLEPNTAYQAIAFTCTRIGCSHTYLGGQGWYRTQAKDTTIPVVAGIIGSLTVIILICVVMVLYKKGLLPCSSKRQPYSVPQSQQVKM